LLRFSFSPPALPESGLYRYMCTTFVDTLRKTFKDGGYSTISENVETAGNFLVGCRGRLFEVESSFQVAELYDDYIACGCAYPIALGSLFSTEELIEDPMERVLRALSASENYSAFIRQPFIVEILKGNKHESKD